MKAPAGLGAAGKRLWKAIVAAVPEGYELDGRERVLLEQACRLTDELVSLEAALRRDGVVVAGSKGQPRTHPALVEARSHRLAIARLLGTFRLDPPAEESPGVRQSRRAARARWERRRAVAALRDVSA